MIITKQLKAKPLNDSCMNWMDTNIKSPVWPILTEYVSLTWRTASGADLHEPEWSNLHKHAPLLPVNVCARTHLNVCKLLQRRVRLFGLC